MSTILFDQTVFGPVHSRRLGVSLGINLLPNDRKVCSFDCLYCECGFNRRDSLPKAVLPTRDEVRSMLESKLRQMVADNLLPDVITFAGNGEPTLHPDFEGVIHDTLALRNTYAPQAKVAVLSNASRLTSEGVCRALALVDDNILKLDAGTNDIVRRLDRPNYDYSTERAAELISHFRDNPNLFVQTLFTSWTENGVEYDNASDANVREWLRLIALIRPPRVMVYTIDRETPFKPMRKTPPTRLDAIADLVRPLVADVQVSY